VTTGPAWVIGAGGLLGSHVRRALARNGNRLRPWDCPLRSFAWNDEHRLLDQLKAAVAEFEGQVRSLGRPWAVLWCAGVGVVGASQEILEVERIAFEQLLGLLGPGVASGSMGVPGVIFLASSAGGIYGDSPDQPITEATLPRPISPYGRHKLALEGLLSGWAASHPAVAPFIGRMSNLYGVGQNPSKPQGLISHMSRSIVLQKPLNIYMPLDTLRDYIYAEDCALAVTRCVEHLLQTPKAGGPAHGETKIIASERTASIAQILGIFASLTRYRPRYLCHSNPSANLQPRCLQFRSHVLRDAVNARRTDLFTGIKLVHQKNLSDFMSGHLRPPPSPRVSS
jgi:UDP-glucose 4-epimerase